MMKDPRGPSLVGEFDSKVILWQTLRAYKSPLTTEGFDMTVGLASYDLDSKRKINKKVFLSK